MYGYCLPENFMVGYALKVVVVLKIDDIRNILDYKLLLNTLNAKLRMRIVQ